jgi:GWxTD domain-containing protein
MPASHYFSGAPDNREWAARRRQAPRWTDPAPGKEWLPPCRFSLKTGYEGIKMKTMTRKYLPFLFMLLFLIPPLLPGQQKTKSVKDLDLRYRKWLEEEVVYIITPKEKEVFLQLESDRERELFIEAFWKHRNPNPDNPENEFKKEHYRRINYANQYLGKDSPGPGWRTDMGRVYIILGEPKSIDKFENSTEVRPTIIWFYEGMDSYGLPSAFSVVFYKKDTTGEYALYSPIKDGPQNLLSFYDGDPTDYLTAYNQLLNAEPQIASVSLSLVPGETTTGLTPSLASDILLASRIPAAPYKKVNDDYAQKLLRYKDIIEVDYTANYIDCDYAVRAIQDRSGTFFVHYLVEPKRLSLGQVQDRYRTNLDINGLISDNQGNTVYQFEKKIPLEINQEQLNKIKAKLFSFQDMFPLVEGNYRLNLIMKNTVSKEFTSFDTEVRIPATSALQMSPLLLANRKVSDSESQAENKPFRFGDIRLVPSPRNDFSSQDSLYLFFQVYGLTRDLKENGSLELSIFKGEEKIYSRTKSLKDYPDFTYFLEEYSLANFPPADYIVKVSLLDPQKNEVLARQANFFITPTGFLPRPWILSLPAPASDDPLSLNILGNELLNKKDIQGGKSLLEKAYRRDPNSAKLAYDFCRALMEAKEYDKIKEVALPFAQAKETYEFLSILGQSCQARGELAEAISYYKTFLSHYGTNINILNSIGDCYNQLGNKEEALVAWQKSLELNPKQDKIRKLVDSLKKQK